MLPCPERHAVVRCGDDTFNAAGGSSVPARCTSRSVAHLRAPPGQDDHRGVRDLEERWMAVPPDGTLRLFWPLPHDLSAGVTGNPRPIDDHGQPSTERPVRTRLSTGAPTLDYRALGG